MTPKKYRKDKFGFITTRCSERSDVGIGSVTCKKCTDFESVDMASQTVKCGMKKPRKVKK